MKRKFFIALLAIALTLIVYELCLPPCRPISRTRTAKARADVASLAMAVRSFAADNGRLPLQLTELTNNYDGKGAYLEKGMPKDPWGYEYVYWHSTGQTFQILSGGSDGKLGNLDDINLNDMILSKN